VEIDSAVSYDLRTLGHPLGPAAREIRNWTLLDTAEGVVIPGEQDLVVETTMTLTAPHSNLDEIRGKDSLVGDCLLAQVVDDEAVAFIFSIRSGGIRNTRDIFGLVVLTLRVHIQ